MKHTLCVLLLLPVLTFTCQAEENRRDGNWWNDQPPATKLGYMIGFFDGMTLGNKFSYWKFIKDEKQQNCLTQTGASYTEFSEKFLAHVTNGQLVDGLDIFYKDFRNRRIEADNAVWLVLNSIAGKPQAELDKMIE